jgi:FkbM family methyltransferase
MLLSIESIREALASHNITLTGVFHVGAHECEELSLYKNLNVAKENIVWVDAIPSKVMQAKERGIPNVYNAVITDKDDEEIEFHISNNGQSSSVLEFGTHTQEHPGIVYVATMQVHTITIDTFFSRNNMDASNYNFWNFDIQGAELLALKGATQSIQHANALYLEVNEKELYVHCGLIHEIDAFLSTHNFTRVLTNMTPHGWGDALYVRKN